MSFQQSKKQQSRTFWRTVFIWIIGLTIPCYILAFFAYAFAAPQVENLIPTEFVTATWTPIDPNAILTQRALTNPAATNIPPTLTPFDNFSTSIPDIATSSFNTATIAPTRFITQTPSLVPPASATPQPTIFVPTTAPTDAPPILIPPTDTPNP